MSTAAAHDEAGSPPPPIDRIPAATGIPVYRIDLAAPPEQRYLRLAKDFAPRIRRVSPLFDEVVEMLFTKRLAGLIKLTSRFTLRRVFDEEQTKEIKSIAQEAKVDVHCAIALNLFLDLMLGCTSGAALVRTPSGGGRGGKAEDHLMHFRTLEWGMDVLKELLVVLEFVNTGRENPEEVIARSVTYAGFVGTLTGVRKNLSLSLNFRPAHECSTPFLLTHQLMVLLGFRESVPSVLRRILLKEDDSNKPSTSSDDEPLIGEQVHQEQLSITARALKLASMPASPCYLTLCDGAVVAIVQKDLYHGHVKTSKEFMVQTNHDPDHKTCCGHSTNKNATDTAQATIMGEEIWLDESEERQQALLDRWIRHVRASTKSAAARLRARQNGVCVQSSLSPQPQHAAKLRGIREEKLQEWVASYPTTNESTHFSCIMDPVTGEIRWIERGPESTEDSGSEG